MPKVIHPKMLKIEKTPRPTIKLKLLKELGDVLKGLGVSKDVSLEVMFKGTKVMGLCEQINSSKHYLRYLM
ncbi:30383_t:CDS:2 [Racocetra persica]|uniref:30383_t:CDS:1 n=1 Tax=Racocetra persica TaxID=160502 RepID=A0ACA9K7Y2_9GLOM|nr:30383_t:CDS:2 [Racocetra persica]